MLVSTKQYKFIVSVYSPVINNPFSTMTYGPEACLDIDSKRRLGLIDANTPGCVPAYRYPYTYVYNINTRAW